MHKYQVVLPKKEKKIIDTLIIKIEIQIISYRRCHIKRKNKKYWTIIMLYVLLKNDSNCTRYKKYCLQYEKTPLLAQKL